LGIQENLTYALGVAGATGFGVLTWFLNSPLLGVVAGVLLGTALTLLTQARIQKRIWRRELAVRNIETIYAPLYKELEQMLNKISSQGPQHGYETLDDSQWKRIRGEYIYHFIPRPLSLRLEKIYSTVNRYNLSIGTVYTLVDREILRGVSEFYGSEFSDIRYSFSPHPGASTGIPLLNLAIFQGDPKQVFQTIDPESSNPTFFIDLVPKRSGDIGIPTREITQADDVAKFQSFFLELSKKIQINPQLVKLKTTVREISQSATKTRDEILRLIKEPWSI
jgi:hypothetical protein